MGPVAGSRSALFLSKTSVWFAFEQTIAGYDNAPFFGTGQGGGGAGHNEWILLDVGEMLA
ncbi:MAG: hypothetical protein AAF501_13365, partial [Pseudomonadota bacterium]